MHIQKYTHRHTLSLSYTHKHTQNIKKYTQRQDTLAHMYKKTHTHSRYTKRHAALGIKGDNQLTVFPRRLDSDPRSTDIRCSLSFSMKWVAISNKSFSRFLVTLMSVHYTNWWVNNLEKSLTVMLFIASKRSSDTTTEFEINWIVSHLYTSLHQNKQYSNKEQSQVQIL